MLTVSTYDLVFKTVLCYDIEDNCFSVIPNIFTNVFVAPVIFQLFTVSYLLSESPIPSWFAWQFVLLLHLCRFYDVVWIFGNFNKVLYTKEINFTARSGMHGENCMNNVVGGWDL